MFSLLPTRLHGPYLVGGFFVLPALGLVLSGGEPPVGPIAGSLLALSVVNYCTFLLAAVLGY